MSINSLWKRISSCSSEAKDEDDNSFDRPRNTNKQSSCWCFKILEMLVVCACFGVLLYFYWTLKMQVLSITKVLNATNVKVQVMQSELNNTKSEVLSLTNNLTATKNELNATNVQVQVIQSEVNNTKNELNATNVQVQVMQSEVNNTKSELNATNVRVQVLQFESNNTKRLTQSLNDSLTVANAHLQKMQCELDFSFATLVTRDNYPGTTFFTATPTVANVPGIELKITVDSIRILQINSHFRVKAQVPSQTYYHVHLFFALDNNPMTREEGAAFLDTYFAGANWVDFELVITTIIGPGTHLINLQAWGDPPYNWGVGDIRIEAITLPSNSSLQCLK